MRFLFKIDQLSHSLGERACLHLKVTSKFVGPVEDVMGKTKREVNLRKGTVQELLENTFKSYPKKKKLEYGGAFIRGVIAEHSEMQSPMLRKGDVL